MEMTKQPDMNAKCSRCDCEFIFDKDDVRECGGSGGKHKPFHFLGVNCPICNLVIEVWNSKD